MLQSPAEQLLPLCHRDRKAYYAAPRVQNLLCYRFNPFLRRLQHVRADAPGPPCERNASRQLQLRYQSYRRPVA